MLDLILSEYAPPRQAGDVVDEGCSLGPRTLLNAGLLPSLSRAGVNVADAAVIPGGLPDGPGVTGTAVDERQRRLIRCTTQLAERVERAIRQGRLPLLLGDCTAGVGTFAGLKRCWDDIAVVWVDAHCDLNTEASTLTGYLGGMPLAAILGESLPWLTAAAGMNGRCDERRVALVGAREFDPYERAFLDRSRITRVTCRELNDSGRANVAAAAISKAAEVADPAIAKVGGVVGPAEAVYLHIDVDALDPATMPSVTFPSPGGLTIDGLLALVDAVASSGKVRALAVTSFNPHRGEAPKSAETLTSLVARIAAKCTGTRA